MKIKILIVVLLAVLLCLLAMLPMVNRMTAPQESIVLQSSSSSSVPDSSLPTSQPDSLPSSVPDTQIPTQAPTQAPTQPATMKPTQPATTAPTIPATKPVQTNPKVEAFVQEKMRTWICPVKDAFGDVVGSRTFASSRGGGKRAHAGLDFVAPHGTKVYAITSGTVQRVAVFYQNTWAVEVANDDGSILRYCEIKTDLKVGDYVKQGDMIGTILRADSGTEMLHMEVYLGDGEGMLTQSGNKTYKYVSEKNFMRRSDLLDPTFLKDLPKG